MNNEKTMIHDLTEGSVPRLLLKFSYPFMLSNLLQVVYNMVDMVVVGQFVGSTGLSGVSIGGDVVMLLTMLCIGFSGAGQVMISQYVGLGDRRAISRTIGTMFTFILAAAIAISVVCLCLTDTILGWMNTPADAFEHARIYVIVCVSGLFFIYGYNTVSAILRGMGDSKRPFAFIAAAAVINLVLDLLFTAVLKMGVFGAALATVIGQAASFIGSLVYLYIKRESFGFDFKPSSFLIDKTKLAPLVKLGLPMALQTAAISISMMFVNSYINSYGVAASAATGIGNKAKHIVSIVGDSIRVAASSMIGQNVGAGKYDRVRSVVNTSLGVCLVTMIVVGTLFLIFPVEIFSIFDTDPEVLAWAPSCIGAAVVSMFSFAFMVPYLALINGIGNASLGFVAALMDGVVARVGLSLLLGIVFKMGVVGFWYGNAIAGFTTAGIGMIYYYSGRWRTRKLIVK